MTKYLGLPPAYVLSCSLAAVSLLSCATVQNPNHNPDAPPKIFGRIVGPDGKGLDGVRITTEPQTEPVLAFEGEWQITQFIRTKKPIEPGQYQIITHLPGWWRGKDRGPVTIEYPGGELKIDDIELVQIEGPELDIGITDTPEEEGPRGPGLIRKDE